MEIKDGWVYQERKKGENKQEQGISLGKMRCAVAEEKFQQSEGTLCPSKLKRERKLLPLLLRDIEGG